MKKNKLPNIAIAIIVILAVRAFAQIFMGAAGISAGEVGTGSLLFVFGALYVAGIVGTVQRKKWAAVLIVTIAIFDGLVAILMTSGPTMIGALTVDILLIAFAITDKKLIDDK